MALYQFQTVKPTCQTGRTPGRSWPRRPDTRWASLSGLGQSQDLLNRITLAQDALSVQNAELNGIGPARWSVGMQIGVRHGFAIPPFDAVQHIITGNLKAILVVPSYTISELVKLIERTKTAEKNISAVTQWLDFVKANVPEARAIADKEGKAMAGRLSRIPRLRSPAAVGWATFKEELENRAKGLLPDVFGGILKMVPWYVWLLGGAAVVAYVFRAFFSK